MWPLARRGLLLLCPWLVASCLVALWLGSTSSDMPLPLLWRDMIFLLFSFGWPFIWPLQTLYFVVVVPGHAHSSHCVIIAPSAAWLNGKTQAHVSPHSSFAIACLPGLPHVSSQYIREASCLFLPKKACEAQRSEAQRVYMYYCSGCYYHLLFYMSPTCIYCAALFSVQTSGQEENRLGHGTPHSSCIQTPMCHGGLTRFSFLHSMFMCLATCAVSSFVRRTRTFCFSPRGWLLHVLFSFRHSLVSSAFF